MSTEFWVDWVYFVVSVVVRSQILMLSLMKSELETTPTNDREQFWLYFDKK